jgi:hypothetical protein
VTIPSSLITLLEVFYYRITNVKRQSKKQLNVYLILRIGNWVWFHWIPFLGAVNLIPNVGEWSQPVRIRFSTSPPDLIALNQDNRYACTGRLVGDSN